MKLDYTEAEIRELWPYLTDEERAQVDTILAMPSPIWEPLPGPQTMAYYSEADIVGYGGAAGGGKTDLGVGLALTAHRKILIIREEATQLEGIIDRMTEILGGRDGFNSQSKIWRLQDRQIELGSIPNAGDETKYQGRPHDFLLLEEVANTREKSVRFLMGWVRTTTPGQRTRIVMTFNPPTDIEGRWVIKFFAPWLDPKNPNPAAPGELRWFATVNGEDKEVPDGRKFVIINNEITYDFDPDQYRPVDIIQPRSRTFIPSRITDNPHLVNTGYMAQLQAMPEPLRSQMLYGDFNAGVMDDPWQVIPTAWVEAAMERWAKQEKKPAMDSMGVDVARGGKDNTEIARRHDAWFDEPLSWPGSETPDGPTVAGHVVSTLRDRARIHIDVIGVGSSPYDFLKMLELDVIPVNVSEKATTTSKAGNLKFFNLRSQLVWQFREFLDPTNNTGAALYPDDRLKRELCSFWWSMSGDKVKVCSREDIIEKVGYSPDRATAHILALMDSPISPPSIRHREHNQASNARREHNPYATRR